jgi:predicted ATPase
VERFQVLDLLTLLVDKSLVVAEHTGGATRYRLLETVRQYALEKLGGQKAVARRCKVCAGVKVKPPSERRERQSSNLSPITREGALRQQTRPSPLARKGIRFAEGGPVARTTPGPPHAEGVCYAGSPQIRATLTPWTYT